MNIITSPQIITDEEARITKTYLRQAGLRASQTVLWSQKARLLTSTFALKALLS